MKVTIPTYKLCLLFIAIALYNFVQLKDSGAMSDTVSRMMWIFISLCISIFLLFLELYINLNKKVKSTSFKVDGLQNSVEALEKWNYEELMEERSFSFEEEIVEATYE
jgi:hypothetical protein